MARKKNETLTDLELKIMNVIWDKKEASVEDIRESLAEQESPLAPSSVRTMLAILMEKSYVVREPQGKGFVYRTNVSRSQARKSLLKVVVERAFAGSAFDLVASVLNSKMVSKQDIEKVKGLIREYEQESAK